MKFIKSNLISRAPKLLSSSFKLVMGRDLESVVANISELKGVPQKIGQLLSMDISQLVPSELKEKLKPLQGESQGLDHEIILEVLKVQVGKYNFLKISCFENLPIGAGSIGQVHRAKLGSADVVFKIQYPDIEKTIDSDMSLLTPVSRLYEFIRPDSKDFSIILKEAKNMLINELNYEREYQNQQFFRDVLSDDQRYYVPIVYPEFSTPKVIAMEYVEGELLNKVIKKLTNSKANLIIANSMLDLFIDEFFLYGKVQTDPNFANYLIRNDSQIVLLDFGAIKDFDQIFRGIYFELLLASFLGNDEKIMTLGETLGLVDKRDNEEAILLFVNFMKDVMSFFKPDHNPVDFRNEKITKNLLESGWKLWKVQRFSKPNSNLVFLHRKLGGLFSLLKEMEVVIDLHPFWEKILSHNKSI